MDVATLQKLAVAVESGKKRSLNAFLGTSDPSSSSQKILKSSPEHAKALLETFRSMFNSESTLPQNCQTLSRLQVFQALLMIHPSYESPWSALATVALKFEELDTTEAFHCVSAIDMFLEDTGSITASGSNNIPMVEDYLRKVVDHLLIHTLEDSGEKILISDLFLGILGFSKRHLSEKFNDEICQEIATVELTARKFPIWLAFSEKICHILSSSFLDLIREVAIEYVEHHGRELSLTCCCSVVDTSFRIATTVSTFSWFRLSIELLVAIHTWTEEYIRLERHIEKSIRRLSLKDFEHFCLAYDSATINTEWVRLSIMVILHRCKDVLPASFVDNLLSSAKDDSAAGLEKSTNMSYGDQLLDYLFVDEEVIGQLELDGTEQDRFLIVEVLDDLSYVDGEGLVIDPDGSKVYSLSRAAKLILTVLHCGVGDQVVHINEEDANKLASERCMNILATVDSFLDDSQDFRKIKAMLSFYLCATIAYFVNSHCRDEIAHPIFEGACSRSTSLLRKDASIATLGLILRSVNGVDSNQDIPKFLEPCKRLIYKRRLDVSTFMHVTTLMARNDFTREALLNLCDSILRQNYTSAWNETGTSFERYEMRTGLFGLLELLRSESWGHLEIQAWSIFSDCLVLNKPQISVNDRTWLYKNISESLLDDDLGPSSWVSHFLRAIIARLGIFMVRESTESRLRFVPENIFVVWEDPTTSAIQTRRVEDIFQLLRLSFVLLLREKSSRGEVSLSKLELKCWEALSRCVQQREVPKNNDRRANSLSTVLRTLLDASEVDTLSVSFATMLAYVAAVHYYLVRVHRQNQDFEVDHRRDDTLILERCFDGILKQEKNKIVHGATVQAEGFSLPAWLARTSYDLFGTREVDVDAEWLTSLHMSLCDLLLENIGGHFLRRTPADSRSLALCTNVVVTVGSVLDVRRHLLSIEKSTATDSDTGIDSETITHTATPFFLAASQCIEGSLRWKMPVETSSKCFDATRLFCLALLNASSNLEFGAWITRLHSAWALYQTVASESGSKRLIEYLEANLRAQTKLPKTDRSVCSLRSIRNSEQVDEATRGLKLLLLNTVKQCVSVGSMDNFELHDVATEEHLVGAVTVVARVCRETAHDLRLGLDGRSGGVTTEMFESYVRAIQACASCMDTISRRWRVKVSPATLHRLVEVVNILREVLQSYPMQDAGLFRSTLMMVLSEFPSIIREGARRQNCIAPRGDMLDQLFDDCLMILKRWSAIRDPNAIPWEDIVGERHIGELIGNDTIRGIERTHRKNITVRFREKEIWSWALSCSFVAMEKEWYDRLQGLVSARERGPIDDCISQEAGSVLAEHQEGTRSTIIRVAKLFRSSTPEVDSEGQGSALDVLAMNMPSAPRLRFCHLLAAMSKVIQYALAHVESCLRTSINEQNVKVAASRLSFLEAVSTIQPWLHFDDTENDFALGTLRWMSILRRKLLSGTQGARYIDTRDLLSCVTKVADLILDLLPTLRKLIGVLRRDDCGMWLDNAFQDIYPGGGDAFLTSLTRKLSVLEYAVPTECSSSSSSLPSFPTVVPPTTGTNPKRTYRVRSKLRSKKRVVTEVPKSRNSIINAFMSLDRRSSESDGVPQDAFVDLEDFLVEG